MSDIVHLQLPFRYVELIAIGLLLLFSLMMLGRVPEIPHADDGGYAATGYQFWHTGRAGVPGFRNVAGLGTDVFVFGRTAAAFQGIFMWLFGVSLFAGLFPSFIAGVGLLGATYALGRSLWGRGSAMLAVAILAASGIFFSASRWARPDILLTFYFVSALYLFASASPGKWSWRYLIAGLMMGLSGDVHLNGFLLAPIPLFFWIILRQERTSIRILTALTYIGAVLVGVVLWLMLHYWPDTDAFSRQIIIHGVKTHGIRILNLGLVGATWREIQRYLSWFWDARFHRHLFEGLTVLACGVWMAAFGGRKERALVVVWFLIFVVAVCFMANPYGWYLIFVWPLFALWLARGFMAVYETAINCYGRQRWALISLSILFVGYLSNLGFWAGKAFLGPSYSAITQELRSVIPQKASVIAGGEWWFALWDRNFTDALYLYLRRLEAETNPEWQFAVAYGDLQAMLDSEVPINEAVRSIGASREKEIREARSFAAKHCSVLRRIQTAASPVLVLTIH
jgi:4-amino-4-deoxy-L-arabinose transferase-like glycosyltransferase